MRHDSLRTESMQDCGLAECTQEIRDKLQTALAMVESLDTYRPARTHFSPDMQRRVREHLRVRRTRERFFEAEIFADPAWDILLELYAAELGQQRVTVSCLCVAAAVPATTALRWINSLVKKGLLVRTNDRMDARRVFVSLSSGAFDAMEGYFASIPEFCSPDE